MCGLKLIEWAAQKGRKSRRQLRIALAPNVRNGATVAFSRKTALYRFAPVHGADLERLDAEPAPPQRRHHDPGDGRLAGAGVRRRD